MSKVVGPSYLGMNFKLRDGRELTAWVEHGMIAIETATDAGCGGFEHESKIRLTSTDAWKLRDELKGLLKRLEAVRLAKK